MAMLRSRRLEAIFGGDLDKVTAAQVRALVAAQVSEAFDLDFKGELYGTSDGEKRNLASDVAAMANTAGGIIVLGVSEDHRARAAAAPGVDISDAQATRIRQIVAAGVSPLPQLDVILVPDEATTERGFILIAVVRSVVAPHAVLVNESLRFPTRNGPTTRHLSEPEVAASYRSRFGAQAERADRLADIETDMVRRLVTANEPWLVTSLVPDLPGDFTITSASFKTSEAELLSARFAPLGGGRFYRVDVGHNTLLAGDSTRIDDTTPSYQALDLRTDGSGTAAHLVHDVGQFVLSNLPDNPAPHLTIADETLAAVVLGGLQLLATHARDRCHASGMAALRVSLLLSTATPRTAIGSVRGHPPMTMGRAIASPPSPSETYADLDDLADGGPGLVAAAARLHQALGHAFGIPELGQMTLDGELAWAQWNPQSRPEVDEWAVAHGVDVVGRPVE